MRCEPLKPVPVPTRHHSRISELWNANHDHSDDQETEKSLQTRVMDLEGYLDKPVGRSRRTGPLDLNHYRIVNEVWHFASVDWGHKCTACSAQSPDTQLICSSSLHRLQFSPSYQSGLIERCQEQPTE